MLYVNRRIRSLFHFGKFTFPHRPLKTSSFTEDLHLLVFQYLENDDVTDGEDEESDECEAPAGICNPNRGRL